MVKARAYDINCVKCCGLWGQNNGALMKMSKRRCNQDRGSRSDVGTLRIQPARSDRPAAKRTALRADRDEPSRGEELQVARPSVILSAGDAGPPRTSPPRQPRGHPPLFVSSLRRVAPKTPRAQPRGGMVTSGAALTGAPVTAARGQFAAHVSVGDTAPPAMRVSSMAEMARRVSRWTVSFLGVSFFIRRQ
jgi:hypothetical protein